MLYIRKTEPSTLTHQYIRKHRAKRRTDDSIVVHETRSNGTLVSFTFNKATLILPTVNLRIIPGRRVSTKALNETTHDVVNEKYWLVRNASSRENNWNTNKSRSESYPTKTGKEYLHSSPVDYLISLECGVGQEGHQVITREYQILNELIRMICSVFSSTNTPKSFECVTSVLSLIQTHTDWWLELLYHNE